MANQKKDYFKFKIKITKIKGKLALKYLFYNVNIYSFALN